MLLVGGDYILNIAALSLAPPMQCALSLSSYPVRYVEPQYSRRDFKTVKLVWLSALILEGPRLVYRDCDRDRAYELRQAMCVAQTMLWSAKKSLGRLKRSDDRSRELAQYRQAAKKLRAVNELLVELAIGYTWPGAEDFYERKSACFLFDGDPYEPTNTVARERWDAPPAR